MADDKKRKEHVDSGAWELPDMEGLLDDEEIMKTLEGLDTPAEAAVPEKKPETATPPSSESEFSQNDYDTSNMFQEEIEPTPIPPPPLMDSSPEPEDDIGLFGTLPKGRRKTEPKPEPEPEPASEKPQAPVSPPRQKAVFEPGGTPMQGQQASLQEARSSNKKIKRVRRNSLAKPFIKFGLILLALAVAAGVAIHYGYHEELPVDQDLKDKMSTTVEKTRQKLDEVAKKTRAEAEKGLEKAGKVLDDAEKRFVETEKELEKMGEGKK